MDSGVLRVIAFTVVYGCLLRSSHALPNKEVVCVTNCSCQVRDSVIVEADCSKRGWYSVPLTLPRTLQSLDLSENHISSISRTILPELNNLHHLSLSSNLITTLAGVFSCKVYEAKIPHNSSDLPSKREKRFFQMLMSKHSAASKNTVGYDRQVHSSEHFRNEETPPESNAPSVFLTKEPFKYLQQLFLGKNLIRFIDNNSFTCLLKLHILDLSFNNISTLNTHSFRGLRNIRSLNLKNNSLRMFPDTYPEFVFSDLPKLKELNLQRNLLFLRDVTLPVNNGPQVYPDKALSYILSLERLHIDGLPNDQIPGPGFRKLTNLTLLDFGNPGSYCHLSGLPELFFSNITTKKTLEVLFTGCRIIHVHPNSFALLPTLSSLSLNHCDNIEFDNFAVFSQSFSHTQIKKLDITYIHRDTVILMLKADWFRHLQKTQLETLIVADNSILKVDVLLSSVLPRTLKTFSLADNKLIDARFLESVPLLVNLEVLNVSVQNRESYSDKLSPLKQSGDSEISRKCQHKETGLIRKITSVSDLEKSQANLNKSSQSGSHYLLSDGRYRDEMSINRERKSQSFANDVISLNDLLRLQRSFCPSLTIASESSAYGDENLQLKFSYPTELSKMYEVINRRNSTGKWLEDEFTKEYFEGILSLPRSLKEIYMSELKLTYSVPRLDFNPSNVLELLDMSKNALWCFEGPIKGLEKLHIYDLSKNHAIALSPYFFDDMPALQRLLMSFNSFGFSLASDTSGKTFSRLTSLEYLDISYNDIRDLNSNIFLNTSRLESLVLSHNALREFQPELGHLVNLTYVDLSTNVFPALSYRNMQDLDMIVSINGNMTVDLSYNPLLCDCTSLDFLKWFQNTKITFQNINLYTCKFINGTMVSLDKDYPSYKTLLRMCTGPSVFIVSLLMFSVVVILFTSFAIYIYYRVRLMFYFYISKARYFTNFSQPSLYGIKDVFIVYDDQEPKWRRYVYYLVKPALEERGVSCHISEIDSLAGKTNRMVIEESVLTGKKTLVLLTEDIFMFEQAELEINMAKLAEDMRQTEVLLFLTLELVAEENIPPHIQSYLEKNRPLVYEGDTPEFWDHLANVIKR